jgi:toxin ParE1/3/4
LKRYEVHFLAEAVTDIDSLFCQIAEKASYEVADRYLARIERLCHSLESFPMRGTAISGNVAGLRKMGFEHRVTILFGVGEERVEVLRILYGGRDLEPILEKLQQ